MRRFRIIIRQKKAVENCKRWLLFFWLTSLSAFLFSPLLASSGDARSRSESVRRNRINERERELEKIVLPFLNMENSPE